MKKNQVSSTINQILSFVFAVACTKKRDAELPYGEDRDLQTISLYEGKEFDLQTFDSIKAATSTGKYKVADERTNAKSKTRNFDYVRYQSKDPLKLTDDTLMLGLPNHQYKVKYLFQGNLLKVMKLATSDELSSDEQAAAIDNKDGRLMVPIVSYNVTFYSIDKKRNDQNEVTSKLELIPLQSSNGATHFKIDFNSKTRATFLSKAMALPVNFFEGENGDSKDWYYAATVIGMNAATEPLYLGMSVQQDTYNRPATKVRAKKLENKIVFFNMGIDERLEKTVDQRVENQSVAVTLPIDLMDYQFSEQGKGTSVKEEASKEKSWEQRGYADVKIGEVQVPGWDLKISEIKDVQMGDGYFSFTAKSEDINGLVRFSFYNVKAYQKTAEAKYGAKAYVPKIYFPEDEKLFGFYSTGRDGIRDFDNSRKENSDRRTFLTRFNPTRTVVEYRLNHDAPDWTEEMAKKAIGAWNASLNAAGSSIRLRLTDDQGKVLRGYPGDLRYSLINMMTEADSAATDWGGLGPALEDPTTGEIIMATANLNVPYYIDIYKSLLTTYLASVRGELDSKYVGGVAIPGLKAVVQATQKTIQIAGSYLGLGANSDLKQIALYNPSKREFNLGFKAEGDAKRAKMTFGKQASSESAFETLNGKAIEPALKVCSDLKKYVDEIKTRQGLGIDNDREIQIISKCAPEIAKNAMISSLVHEIGHNLGLRHNFAGSADPQNFYSAVDVKTGEGSEKVQWQSSSIMEYFQMNHSGMTQPGLYDIAAIRWGYQDQVEAATGGQMLKADPSKSTKLNMKTAIRSFRYCTDEHLSLFADDPFCAQFDVGYDPETIVDLWINKYDYYLALENNRLGRTRMSDMNTLALSRYERFVIPMQKFYEAWRDLLAKSAGFGEEYLEKYDTKAKYQELLEKAFDEGRLGKAQADLNKKYYNASKKIFQFLSRLAFTPDYSCITQRVVNDTAVVQLFSVSSIQRALYSKGGKTIQSCQEPEVQNYLEQTRGAKVIGEGGLPFDNTYKDLGGGRMDPSTGYLTANPETIGVAMDRYFAMRALTTRSSILMQNERAGFQPSFLDEWEFRDELSRRMLTRLTKGIPVGELLLKQKLTSEIPTGIHSLNYATEAPLLATFWGLFKEGLRIPGKEAISDEIREKYSAYPAHLLIGNNNAKDMECFTYGPVAYCALKDSKPAMTLVKQLQTITKRRNSWKVTEDTVNTFWSLVAPLVPEEGHAAEADMTFFENVMKAVDAWKDKEIEVNKDRAERMYREMETLYFIFEKDQEIWKTGVKKMADRLKTEDLDKVDMDARILKIKQEKLLDLARRKLGNKEYMGLDRKILADRIQEMVTRIEEDFQIHQADQPEWEAQADTLIKSLLSGEQ